MRSPTLPHSDHLLAAFQGTYNALAWMYADYTIQSERAKSLTYEGYLMHYDTLSDRLNYAIKPRERHMTGYAQFMVRRLGNVSAGLVALRVAEHYYPRSETVKKLIMDMEALSDKSE